MQLLEGRTSVEQLKAGGVSRFVPPR